MAERPVRMPALSATMEDAVLLAWLVEIGDDVRAGQPLAEVATDKVDMELESPSDGTVAELLVEAGTKVDLGDVIATLTSEEADLLGDLDLSGSGSGAASDDAPAAVDAPAAPGADVPVAVPDAVVDPPAAPAPASPPEPAATSEPASSPEPAVAADPPRRRIAPAPPPVRKRAKTLGIDLSEVTPTGSRGHVTHADLSRHLEAAARRAAPAASGSAPAAAPAARAARAPAGRAPATAGSTDRRAIVRRATARITTRSAAIPQFTLHRSIDLTRASERRDGRSWTTELARALASALWRHPECNATWDEEAEAPVPLGGVRIGVAVDTPNGLVVVGVDDPDGVDPGEADREVRAAIERARTGKVALEDTRSVSSTISNLGGLGIDRFDALLLPPQPTILSVGRIVPTPVAVDGAVQIRPLVEVGLTVDHRVADGADGARLLAAFARRLET